jgi:hypothetical protein
MFNPYSIILGLFTTAGLLTTLWGWIVIARSHKTRTWPSVTGTIVTSNIATDADDLLPDIRFSYNIADRHYVKSLEFPGGTTPTQELSQQYIERFPQGASVAVHYNPDRPDQATLEPGPRPGDWMILAFGLGTVVLMLAALLIGN